MPVSNAWHFATTEAAQRAGVTEPCSCNKGKKKLYPTRRHFHGKMPWRVNNPGQPQLAFATKAEADAWDTKVKADLQKGIAPLDLTAGRMLFRTYAEEWLAMQSYAPSARATNAGYLKNHLNPVLGDLQLRQITHTTVTAWLAQMRTKPNPRSTTGAPYSPATVELVYILLCTILSAAVHDKRIPASPCKDVTFPKAPPRPDLMVWESETVDALLSAVPDPQHALLLLAAHCGHRQGEVFAVAVEDIRAGEIAINHQVQRVAGELTLVACKHSSLRTVPLPGDVADALALHLQRYPALAPMSCTCPRRDHQGKTWRLLFHDQLPGYVHGPLARPRGVPLLAAQWNTRVWHPALKAATLDPANSDATGLHMLRHYCASEWIAGGATVPEVQRWLGHKSMATTEMIYTHLFTRAAARGRQIMDGVFAARRERALRAVGPAAYPARTRQPG